MARIPIPASGPFGPIHCLSDRWNGRSPVFFRQNAVYGQPADP